MATAEELAKQHAAIFSGRVGAPTTPNVPAPVADFMTKVGNVLEVPLTVLGAGQMDYQRARRAGASPLGATARTLGDLYTPGSNTSVQHALDMIIRGHLGNAADLYSTTSILANKQRAALGDRLAQYFQHHPTQFGAAAFAQEFANPANILTGEETGALKDYIAGSRIPTLNRFKSVRDAARRAAQQRTAAPAAEQARAQAAQGMRYDVAGETAKERAAHHFAQKQAESAQIQRQRAEAASRTSIPAAPSQPMLTGQRFAQALAPPADVAAAGEARLALPPPKGVSPEQLAEQHAPIMRAPRTKPARYQAPPSATVQTPEQQLAGELGAAPPTASLPPGKEPGMTTPGSAIVPYNENAPIAASGPAPKQGPFRYNYSPEETADQAEIALRKMAETKGVRRQVQDITHNLGKGLTIDQQRQMVDMIEGTVPVPDRLQARVDQYRKAQQQITNQLLDLGIAKPGEVRTSEHYFPRLGSTMDPQDIALESEAIAAAPHEYFSQAVRKGTLAKRRLYDTYEQARHSGAPINPDWEPMKTLETSLLSRLESVHIEQQMQKLRELGLLTYPGEARPEGWETLEDHPDLRNFGSPSLRTASFPPEVAKAIRDITVRESSLDPDKLLKTPLTLPAKLGNWANWAASRWQTASPLYHGEVNLLPSQLATIVSNAKNPIAAAKALAVYGKELAVGRNVGEAMKAGATSPFASDVPAYRMLRPWRDLPNLNSSPGDYLRKVFSKNTLQGTSDIVGSGDKWQRIKDLSGRLIENVTARPLYQWMEPRMAAAAHKALQAAGNSDARAALLTRQTIGEPENLPGAVRGLAQLFQFPTWRIAMTRLWPYLLGRTPALYQGPQRGARAYNISRGAYDQGAGEAPPITSSAHLIPELMVGRDKTGAPNYLSIPSPANIPLEMANLIPVPNQQTGLMRRLFSLGSTLANPSLASIARGIATGFGSPGFQGTGTGGFRLVDKDAPQPYPGQQFVEALRDTGTRYAPIQPNPTGLLETFGIGTRAIPGENARQHEQHIEMRARHNIHKLRREAQKAAQNGRGDEAAAKNAQADYEYNRMVEELTGLGMMPSP